MKLGKYLVIALLVGGSSLQAMPMRLAQAPVSETLEPDSVEQSRQSASEETVFPDIHIELNTEWERVEIFNREKLWVDSVNVDTGSHSVVLEQWSLEVELSKQLDDRFLLRISLGPDIEAHLSGATSGHPIFGEIENNTLKKACLLSVLGHEVRMSPGASLAVLSPGAGALPTFVAGSEGRVWVASRSLPVGRAVPLDNSFRRWLLAFQTKPDPGKQALPAPKPPPAPPAKKEDDTILIPNLNGVVFVDSIEKVRLDGAPDMHGVDVSNVELLQTPEFAASIEPYLDSPLKRSDIRNLQRDVIRYYRRQGRPIVDIILLGDQNVTNGVIQMVALEGHLGDIRVEGANWFSDHHYTGQLKIKSGDPINLDQVRSDVEWVNKNTFHQVSTVFSQGRKLGETDLTLQVQERFPVRFYFGYEDSGNDTTGEERWITGFNWGNALAMGHQATYQFITSSNVRFLTGHSGSYEIYLPWRHIASLSGNYINTVSDLAPPFGLSGVSWQVSPRYQIPLPGSGGKFSHDLVLGADFKESNSNLQFNLVSVLQNTTQVNQWLATYQFKAQDDYGVTSGSTTFYHSPGAWSSSNKDHSFQLSRERATAEYQYAVFNLERLTLLPYNSTWTLKGTCQIADSNLLPSEQIGFGGVSSIRGYDEREVGTDEGWRISNEYRTPPMSLLRLFNFREMGDELRFIGFWDYGIASNLHLLEGEDPNVIFSGAGPGIRYNFNPFVTFRADYGFQLIDTGNERYASRLHMGLIFSY